MGAVGLSTLLFVFSNLFFNFLTVVTTSNVAGAYAVNDEQEVCTDAEIAVVAASKGNVHDCGAAATAPAVLL